MLNFTDTKNPAKERPKKPRISVNKLAEYISAGPPRRNKIVSDCKTPVAFIVTRYSEARTAVKSYFEQNSPDILNAAIEVLEKKEGTTDFQKNDIKNSIALLNSLLNTDVSRFNGMEIKIAPGKDAILEIKGVEISVNPDLYLSQTMKGIKNIGAIKLSLTKSGLSSDQQKIVALMTKRYLQANAGKDEVVNGKMCFSLDAFKKSFTEAPASDAQRMRAIEYACEEIALWWGRV
ncbi:hypothetical protein [Dyadobacter sp. OTU695]|uniref:hypothetical protein n=1 Tax=Dyadobacter sp. OTU695 TaxID=3043860 RepID=UPI00313D904B